MLHLQPEYSPPPSNNVDWSHYLNRFTKHVPLCQSKPLDSRGQKRKKKCLMMTPPTNNEDQQRMKRPLSLSHEAAPTGEERGKKKEKKKEEKKKNQLVAQPTSNQPHRLAATNFKNPFLSERFGQPRHAFVFSCFFFSMHIHPCTCTAM